MTEPTEEGERRDLARAGLKPCRECKELIRKDATRCPHCGVKQNRFGRTIGCLLAMFWFIVILALLFGGCWIVLIKEGQMP